GTARCAAHVRALDRPVASYVGRSTRVRVARQRLLLLRGTPTTEIYTLSLHDALPIFAHPAELKNRVPQTQDRRGALLPECLHISLGEDPLTLLVDHTPGNALDRDPANLVEPFGLVGLQHRRLDQRPLHSRQRPHPHRASPFGAFHVTGFEVAGTENLVATKKRH